MPLTFEQKKAYYDKVKMSNFKASSRLERKERKLSFDFIKVKAIGVTEPVVEEIPDAEGIVSYAARVSNPQNQSNFETAGKLLKYCVEHGHYSVFETVNVVMEIEAPRDIARQILRHRSFSFQEFSQRYAEVQSFVYRQPRYQDQKNRQNSVQLDISQSDEDWEVAKLWGKLQQEVLGVVEKNYNEALKAGIAKEVARVLLPEGLTMSRMYMNGTLRSWLHYCELRGAHGTQLEHVDVAQKAKQELVQHFPFLEDLMKA